MGDVFIRYLNMPSYKARAFTATDPNGDYNIYVNTVFNYETQKEAVDHELRHINDGHFFRDSSAAQDEWEAEEAYSENEENSAVNANLHQSICKTNNPGRPVHPVFYHRRQRSGLTALQVSKLAGISQSTYMKYEYCLRPCPPEDEQAIMNILGKYK